LRKYRNIEAARRARTEAGMRKALGLVLLLGVVTVGVGMWWWRRA
jgi:hypothetical protein